nr:hypothetical protein [Tanacetum cinerariifolium]
RRIFNILNRTSTAKEIWDSLELLMKGFRKMLERQKEDMFDEYKRFRANGNESIQAYFIRFHKLVNDIKKQFPPTNNQLRASSNLRSQATIQAGQIVTETVQRSAPGNVGKQGKRENQANG